MHGNQPEQNDLYSYITLDDSVPVAYALRPLKAIIDNVLKSMTKKFDERYATCRPSKSPEMLV